MRDRRKFCRPKTTNYPQVGDVQVKLKCGTKVYVKIKEYLKVKDYFKVNSVVGETTNSAGNVEVLDKDLNREIIVTSQDYVNNQDKFELIGIVSEKHDTGSPLAQEGDIIVHSNTLNRDAIFSFTDWLSLSDDWDLEELYGITTYEEEDASNGDYIIMANGHTLIISPSDYSKVSSNWEHVDTIVIDQQDDNNP